MTVTIAGRPAGGPDADDRGAKRAHAWALPSRTRGRLIRAESLAIDASTNQGVSAPGGVVLGQGLYSSKRGPGLGREVSCELLFAGSESGG
jgi:hypothetical protein